ncbi:MAG: hypothetical protein J6U53_01970 [Tidjanibacter sp.]|nr:hypothetical protein [Tidjanibacter sp.]
MYDYKSLRKIVTLLAVLFGVVVFVLVVTMLPLNKFAWLSVLFLLVVGGYFVTIPLKLIREMKDMEAMIEKYKNAAKKD